MTSADDNGPEPAGDDLVAAEYVLGVLPAQERQAAAERIESDPAFARLVDAWEDRLSPMAAAYPEVDPPAALKQAIDRRLFANRQARAEAPRAGFWQSLALWRGLAAAAVVALVVAIAVPFVMQPGGAPQQVVRLVASLAPHDSDVHYLAVYDAQTHELGLSHVTGDRPQGRDFELWVIEGDNPAQSLGVIPAGSRAEIPISDALRAKLESGSTLAISVEPPGGSPTGQATGPVVAAGGLSAI